MTSSNRGIDTSAVEVSHISRFGIWLLAHDRERFPPYDKFPWFLAGTVAAVLHVVEAAPGHFRWPDLDVDLTDAMIDDPDRYPLVSRRPAE